MVTCKMPLVLIMRTSLAATMCAIGRKIFDRQLGENFTRDQHGNTDERDICESVHNFGVKPTRMGGGQSPPPLRLLSWNFHWPQPIYAARRVWVRSPHPRLDLRTGARRVEPKPHLFALRQKLRIRH